MWAGRRESSVTRPHTAGDGTEKGTSKRYLINRNKELRVLCFDLGVATGHGVRGHVLRSEEGRSRSCSGAPRGATLSRLGRETTLTEGRQRSQNERLVATALVGCLRNSDGTCRNLYPPLSTAGVRPSGRRGPQPRWPVTDRFPGERGRSGRDPSRSEKFKTPRRPRIPRKHH